MNLEWRHGGGGGGGGDVEGTRGRRAMSSRSKLPCSTIHDGGCVHAAVTCSYHGSD